MVGQRVHRSDPRLPLGNLLIALRHVFGMLMRRLGAAAWN
jgi:hypothetical protein